LVHPAAGVGNDDSDVWTRVRPKVTVSATLRAQLEIAGRQRQAAPSGHGILRVDRQVQQHLLHLSSVDLDQIELRGKIQNQLDLLAQRVSKKALDVRHDCVQIDDGRLQNLLATEGQELSG
jgi:hypothetical protein